MSQILGNDLSIEAASKLRAPRISEDLQAQLDSWAIQNSEATLGTEARQHGRNAEQLSQRRIELYRQGSLDAVADVASKYDPRVIAVPKNSDPVILLIFAYVVLLRCGSCDPILS